jgi:hypothetical protein
MVGMLIVTVVAVLALCVDTGAARVVAAAVVNETREPSAKLRFDCPSEKGRTATL